MLTILIIILGISFLLYTLLGGADFGAGVVEIFASRREEATISKAMAPVWEANHVWLILAVVILFTGFPAVYASLSLVLHIPFMLVLIGIIFRGCAFTFRHYDVVSDNSHKYFTVLFRISSLITPLFLGMTLGAMMLGRITFNMQAGFYEVFISPWLNIFCVAIGLFSISLFAYIASVFLVGETKNNKERIHYAKIAKRSMIITMLLGIIIFAAAETEGRQLAKEFGASSTSIIMLLIATLFCPFIWVFLNKDKNKTLYLRIGAGVQVTSILAGWFSIQFPVLINVKNAEPYTFYNMQAPVATQQQLLIALLTGLVLVVPGFIYLFKVFKIKAPVT